MMLIFTIAYLLLKYSDVCKFSKSIVRRLKILEVVTQHKPWEYSTSFKNDRISERCHDVIPIIKISSFVAVARTLRL